MSDQEKNPVQRRLRFSSWLLAATLMVLWSRGATADTLRPVSSPGEALASTAAVVEGSATEVSYTYDAAAGPRTVVRLQSLTTHLGHYSERTLELSTLGGPIDGRRWLFIPELPQLTANTRYLLFLTNVDWFFNPVVADYVFRLEPGPRGYEVLIDPAGHAVLGVSADGLVISSDPVVDMQIDFLTPHEKPRLLEGASTLLADAMSKDDFLAAIRDLARATPPQGEYHRGPARDRVWNRTATAEE